MEDELVSGNMCKYVSVQILNLFTFSLGIAILIIDFLIWAKVKSFNSFIFSLILISFYILVTSTVGCKVRYSPTMLIIYFFLVIFVFLGNIILLFFIIYDQEQIVYFLVENMNDSRQAIEEAKRYLDENIDIIKILLLCYFGVLLLLLIISINYRRSLKDNITQKQNRLLQGDAILLRLRNHFANNTNEGI